MNDARRVPLAAVLAIAFASAMGGACAKASYDADEGPAPRREPCACEPSAPVVDPTLLAFLSKARAAHHEADLSEDAGDRARAITILEQLVRGPVPPGMPPPPEVSEVIADTRARLADLRSAGGDFDGAGRDIDDGLQLATGPTHFRGRLFEVRGLIEERREKALKEKGDMAGAERAHQAAIKAFEAAIAIQDEVIGQALRDAGPAVPPASR